VTRAYQTRHGAGPFREKNLDFRLYNNDTETNTDNEFQGKFRTNYLDIDKLNYALKCDNNFSHSISKNLIVTCLDHFNSENIVVFKDEKKRTINYREITNELLCEFKYIKYSFSNCAEYLI
jgi:adenylosuccinate synthase